MIIEGGTLFGLGVIALVILWILGAVFLVVELADKDREFRFRGLSWFRWLALAVFIILSLFALLKLASMIGGGA